MEMNTEQVAKALNVSSLATVVNYTRRKDFPLKVTENKRGLKVFRTYQSEDVEAFANHHGITCNLPK